MALLIALVTFLVVATHCCSSSGCSSERPRHQEIVRDRMEAVRKAERGGDVHGGPATPPRRNAQQRSAAEPPDDAAFLVQPLAESHHAGGHGREARQDSSLLRGFRAWRLSGGRPALPANLSSELFRLSSVARRFRSSLWPSCERAVCGNSNSTFRRRSICSGAPFAPAMRSPRVWKWCPRNRPSRSPGISNHVRRAEFRSAFARRSAQHGRPGAAGRRALFCHRFADSEGNRRKSGGNSRRAGPRDSRAIPDLSGSGDQDGPGPPYGHDFDRCCPSACCF